MAGAEEAGKKLLRDASRYQAAGDTVRATDAYRVVLMLDPANETARRALDGEP